MQIGDRIRYREGVRPDDLGLITGIVGEQDTGLTLDILLDSGRQIRVIASADWAVIEDE